MKPYKFQPYLKSTIWGGEKIAPFKGVETSETNVGESWEISGVPGHESIIADGEDKGLNLVQLIDKYKDQLVGKKVYEKFGNNFPLLIKFIDSKQDLSVQVHPNDELAKKRHNCAGKTEMWYIIKTDPGAKIYAGLSKSITPEDYEHLAAAETVNGHSPIQEVIATHDAKPGDIYFLPAGRVHAIGAGNFLAEIQQTSDITYRVYDYGRRDANGNTRELHVEQAKDAIDYKVYPDYRSSYDTTKAISPLIKCQYFDVKRVVVKDEAKIDYQVDSFVIVICIEGKATINGVDVHQGETILVPSCDNVLDIKGNGVFLTAVIN